ncbi:Rz1-like lysis system protein LysC [Marilutibacter maris]
MSHPKLTEPCAQVGKRDNTVGEAVRLANARKAALDECSARMAQIRALGEEPQD